MQRLDEFQDLDELPGARLAEPARDGMLRVAPVGQRSFERCLAGTA